MFTYFCRKEKHATDKITKTRCVTNENVKHCLQLLGDIKSLIDTNVK